VPSLPLSFTTTDDQHESLGRRWVPEDSSRIEVVERRGISRQPAGLRMGKLPEAPS
jgi:hypothetical protein